MSTNKSLGEPDSNPRNPQKAPFEGSEGSVAKDVFPSALAEDAGRALTPSAHDANALASSRDEKGRFITGNIGGGRRRGAKNKLSELLLALVVDDFAEHGARTIATLRQEDPATYLRLVSSLVPRQLIVKREEQADADYADMSYEEIGELIEAARRGRIIRKAIEG